MSAFLWRVILALVCFLLAVAILPPFFNLVGFRLAGDAWEVIRICLGGIAVLYALFGKAPPAPWA